MVLYIQVLTSSLLAVAPIKLLSAKTISLLQAEKNKVISNKRVGKRLFE
jgi:hypothetical protein